nr:uncharacterized protein LOC108946138 [Nicotiana tomentosiformis]
MAYNNVNGTRNPEIQGKQTHFEDSISDTRNEGNDATPVHDRQYPRQVRETTPDDAEAVPSTDNTDNSTRDPEIQGEQPHFEDSISDTRNEEHVADTVGSTSSGKGREKNIVKAKDDCDADRRTSRGRLLPYERTEGHGRNFRASNKFTVDRGTDRDRNSRSLQDKETSGSRDLSYTRLSEYNFDISIVELVSTMRNIKGAQFPRPMRYDTGQRNPNLWCEYHGMNGHWTRDCRHLQEEVSTLLKNGHLREFLSDRAKNNYGSLANIIQWRVLEKDKLTGIIVPATKHLAGFNLASMTTQGEILLLTNAKGVMKTTLLEVVDGDKGYNIILVRPWLHDMKVVPSTYHQLLKFPMPEGIKQIRGEQLTVRETNAILVSSSKGKEHKA